VLHEWGDSNGKRSLFKIDERWGIRNNSFAHVPAVIVHRCDNGELGNVHDLARSNYKCGTCRTHVPDKVQALWLLRTCGTKDRYYMKTRGEINDKS